MSLGQSNYNSFSLRVVIVKTSFSHPENFVKRSSKRGEYADIDDPDGSWMNAGVGGESNTVDLQLELHDFFGSRITICDTFPIKIRLWTCEYGFISGEVKEEISQRTPCDKTGNRRGEFLMVSGKPGSKLFIDQDGTGFVSVRITTTSQLNERKQFAIEVLPDFITDTTRVQSLKRMFGDVENHVKQRDSTSRHPCLSKPIDVMSKINKLAKKREDSNPFVLARLHVEKAISLLQNFAFSNPREETDFYNMTEILKLAESLKVMLEAANGMRLEASGVDVEVLECNRSKGSSHKSEITTQNQPIELQKDVPDPLHYLEQSYPNRQTGNINLSLLQDEIFHECLEGNNRTNLEEQEEHLKLSLLEIESLTQYVEKNEVIEVIDNFSAIPQFIDPLHNDISSDNRVCSISSSRQITSDSPRVSKKRSRQQFSNEMMKKNKDNVDL